MPLSLFNKVNDRLFGFIHDSKLIYNTCWEDPLIDRHLLQLGRDSQVVMITSAGCNALDYLLDEPLAIHAVDMNFRQNALLKLKLEMIRTLSHEDFFKMFGQGSHLGHRELFDSVKTRLSNDARQFWESNISYFDQLNKSRRSFYYHGTTGVFAWALLRYLFKTRKNLQSHVDGLLEAKTLKDQRVIYSRIESDIWTHIPRWFVKQSAVMAMLGVPRPQIRLIKEQYPGGLGQFVQDKLRNVFMNIEISENYFWRVYMKGSYTPECCPNYLKEENFEPLKLLVDKVRLHTATLSDFLKRNPGRYSHFVLLDHQDWLAAHDPDALEEEWQLILENSQKGSKILMRSAGMTSDFIPDMAKASLRFFPEATTPLHDTDRVGTYGSLHFAEVV